MSKATSARVVLKGDPLQKEAPVQAAQTVIPGQLVERIGINVQPHSTANGSAEPLFARERDLFGKDKDEVIPAGDQCMFVAGRQGDEIQAFLLDGENVVEGDELVSAGTGALQSAPAPVAGTPSDRVVAYAIEAVNNTSGGDVRIEVEVA